ncbi:MAG: hypothetical protein ED557_04245 [Balneola sp.]|nr:MAG: hypothetical protein ED557_04245 [Balneola sp.]
MLTVTIPVLLLAQAQDQNDSGYKVIYEADRDGNALIGSLEELIDYVEKGNPIRVGWELGVDGPNTTKLIHWTDAGFITIHKGHVFAQISSIYSQGTSAPSIEMPFVSMMNAEPDGWVAIVGTTGLLGQKFKRDPEMIQVYKGMRLSEEEIEEEFKNQERTKVKTKWAVLVR